MDNRLNLEDLANKLFCTFTTQENLPLVLEDVKRKYQILFNKIFALFKLEGNR